MYWIIKIFSVYLLIQSALTLFYAVIDLVKGREFELFFSVVDVVSSVALACFLLRIPGISFKSGLLVFLGSLILSLGVLGMGSEIQDIFNKIETHPIEGWATAVLMCLAGLLLMKSGLRRKSTMVELETGSSPS